MKNLFVLVIFIFIFTVNSFALELETSGFYGGFLRDGSWDYEKEDELYGGKIGLRIDEFQLDFKYDRSDRDGYYNETLYGLDLLYNFEQYSILEPYVLIGGGISEIDRTNLDYKYRTFVGGGFGLRLYITNYISWRNEAIYNWCDYEIEDEFFLKSGISFHLPLYNNIYNFSEK